MKLLLCGFFMIGLSAASAADSPAMTENDLKEVGSLFLKHQVDGDFRKAADMVHPGLRAKLTPAQIELAMVTNTTGLGAFVRMNESRTTLRPRYGWVDIPCTFTHGDQSVRVLIDLERYITSIQWLPIDPEIVKLRPRPAMIEAPVNEIKITIGSTPWELSGVVSTPKQAAPKAVVLFVHDSGPLNHDAQIGAHAPFRDLAHELGKHGIAAVRYNKRTLQYASKFPDGARTIKEDVLDDALAAATLIRTRSEFSDLPVFLVGHGLGATLAPEIATLDGKFAGVVMLSARARASDDGLHANLEELAKIAEDEIDEQSKDEAMKSHAKIQRLQSRSLPPDEPVLRATAAYYYDLFEHDGRKAADFGVKLPIRMLIVGAGRDPDATEEDFKLWKSKLSSRKDAAFQWYADLTRWLTKGSGAFDASEVQIPRRVDRQVVDDLAKWILAPSS